MGVDNSAILFLGLPSGELGDELDAMFGEDADYRDAIDALPKGNKLTWQDTNHGTCLIGYKLADSGSYGYREVVELRGQLELRREDFIGLFKKVPRAYIVELQW